jgi:hypothetical protein
MESSMQCTRRSRLSPVLSVFLLLVGLPFSVVAQSYAGDEATVEPIFIVDKPTAGMLHRATYAVSGNFFQNGGVLTSIAVGVFDRFMIGISYGGTDIIGPAAIRMNPLPGVQAKLRIISEGSILPAIAVGFDSQGKEPYVDSLSRYAIKSPGAYISASRNYAFLGNLSVHGGVNFTMERQDGDKDMNAYLGLEKSIGEAISVLAEYDFGFNDNHGQAVGEGKGYLNLAFRWNWGGGLVVGFDLKNVTKNQKNISVANRTLQIDFVGSL